MGECFWSQDSIVGLTRECPVVAPTGDVLSFTPTVDGDGYYQKADGASYGLFSLDVYAQSTPAFDAALSAAGFSGTINGLSFVRSFDESGPGSLGALGEVLPEGVTFAPASLSFPISDGGVYDGYIAAYATSDESDKYFYGRVEIGGQTFYGLFAVGSGI